MATVAERGQGREKGRGGLDKAQWEVVKDVCVVLCYVLQTNCVYFLFFLWTLPAFGCPYENCPKRFSRSDNLNQHVRIHRHEKEKVLPKPFTCFTPFSPQQ